jgi:predicted RNase H-like HicB family nuclease
VPDVVTRDQYLRIPYVLVVESVPGPEGEWRRRASYPEVPGAVAEADSVLEAMDRAEQRRVRIILDWLDAGLPVPVPRPPLDA